MIFWGLIFAFNFPGVIDIWVIKDEVASNLTFLIGQNILDNNENISRKAFIDCYSAKLVNAQLSSSFQISSNPRGKNHLLLPVKTAVSTSSLGKRLNSIPAKILSINVGYALLIYFFLTEPCELNLCF